MLNGWHVLYLAYEYLLKYVPAKGGWPATAESGSSQGFFNYHSADYAPQLSIMSHFAHDVPHYYLREFFLATVAFWLAHWDLRHNIFKEN